MNLVLDLFTKKELMIIGIVVGSLVLIVLILIFVDIISKKKKENSLLEEMFNEFDQESTMKVEITEDKKVDVSLEKEVEKQIEYVKNDNEVENIEEIKLEDNKNEEKEVISQNIETINNEVIKEKEEKIEYIEPLIMDIDDDIQYVENTKDNAQQELLKIEEELKNPKSLEDTLTNLEIMEEENAIISYQELLENTSELNIVEGDSGDEPISLKEILNMYEESDLNELDVEKEMSKTTLNDAYKGDFTSSPYLSPILGLETLNEYEKNTSTSLAEIQLENTANLEKLDKEIRKTNEFLSILNDLKKNLD